MKTLGVVLAGGRSSRFGSDKAEAVLDGETLLSRAVAAISPHCDAVVVVGRTFGSLACLGDWPRAEMGPLGGIAAALHHARDEGFGAVLSIPVDCGAMSAKMVATLHPAPAHIASQPVIGLWPVTALAPLEAILTRDGKHSMMRFCEAIGSRAVTGFTPDNINTPADLARVERQLKDIHDRP